METLCGLGSLLTQSPCKADGQTSTEDRPLSPRGSPRDPALVWLRQRSRPVLLFPEDCSHPRGSGPCGFHTSRPRGLPSRLLHQRQHLQKPSAACKPASLPISLPRLACCPALGTARRGPHRSTHASSEFQQACGGRVPHPRIKPRLPELA